MALPEKQQPKPNKWAPRKRNGSHSGADGLSTPGGCGCPDRSAGWSSTRIGPPVMSTHPFLAWVSWNTDQAVFSDQLIFQETPLRKRCQGKGCPPASLCPPILCRTVAVLYCGYNTSRRQHISSLAPRIMELTSTGGLSLITCLL